MRWDQDYCEPEMRPLPDAGIVVVKAAMGVGKTKALNVFLQGKDSVLMVTFSRALAAKLVAEFDDMVDYQTKEGYLDDDRVVVCLDSLWRIKTARFDYVVLDEAVSVLLHFNSYLMKRASENAAALDAYMTSAGHVFVVDAAVDLPFVGTFVSHLETARSQKAVWVRNRYVRPTNRVATIRDKPRGKVALDDICEDVRRGKRVVVCSSTKRFVEQLVDRVSSKCPRARIVAHHGDQSQSDPLDDVHKLWSQADLLVYSPSVTAGVSFELEHFDVLYANFVKSMYTPGVEISLQQLFRVRRLRLGTMTIWYSQMGGDAKTPLSVDCPTFVGLNPKIQGGLDHRTPLGRVVANGVLEMRRRSDARYREVLEDTLRREHAIPVS